MCTSVILYRKEHPWPLIIGSNRDEKLSRKTAHNVIPYRCKIIVQIDCAHLELLKINTEGENRKSVVGQQFWLHIYMDANIPSRTP